ncbi:Hypothetical predicted protein [Octopus vulgaris]|uniref:Uncharacterized protein n=1 Tax=Octopus vulgaris TaxID=6645 RepID=A0AA36FNT3_OCTVU|nr:Hypothetical predicted protein [Octopus vulgaris]
MQLKSPDLVQRDGESEKSDSRCCGGVVVGGGGGDSSVGGGSGFGNDGVGDRREISRERDTVIEAGT